MLVLPLFQDPRVINLFSLSNNIMHIHSSTNLEDVQRALANKYLTTDLINEYECIKSQSQIMSNIKQLLEKKNSKSSHNNTLENLANLEASSISQVNYTYNSNDDSLFKSKFTEEFEQSIVSAALKDVKTNCSEETYETVKQYIQNHKVKEAESVEKKLEKLKEEKEDVSSQFLILKLEKNNLEKELDKYRKIVNGVEEEKNNVKKRVDYVLKKQNQIYKLQTSFAFKEKINLELKKRYERLRDNALSNQQKIRDMFEQLDELWNLICNKMESVDCPTKCWKKDAMKRAKDQLIQQRKLIREESEHIEKQYEIMNIVSNQFKKIFHEPERSNNENNQSHSLNSTDSLSGSQAPESKKKMSVNSEKPVLKEENMKNNGKMEEK